MTLPSWRRWLPPVALLALGGAVYASGLHCYLGIATLQDQRFMLQRFVAEHQIMAPTIFGLAYAAVTALSLPGAVFVTLAGGFLFGTLEHVPEQGESIVHDGWRFAAAEMEGRRVRRVKVNIEHPESAEGPESED